MRTKICTLGLICLLMLGSVVSAEKKKPINSWQELFPDPVETLYIIMKDDKPFKVSSGEKGRIFVSAEGLKKELKNTKKSYDIKDIVIIIHNHRTRRKFSLADWRFYRDLKRRGFNGLFLLYCHRTNKAYDIEDDKKRR